MCCLESSSRGSGDQKVGTPHDVRDGLHRTDAAVPHGCLSRRHLFDISGGKGLAIGRGIS